MKIIDALKELPLIEKKLQKNNSMLAKYSSYGSHVGPEFSSEKEQTIQVSGLIASSSDLIKRYIKIKRVLAVTNATIKVTIDDTTMTIMEWITYRNKGAAMFIAIPNSISTKNGANDINTQKVDLNGGVPVSIVRCYDEVNRVAFAEEYENIRGQVDATLEKINATTDLVEEI